MIFSLKKEPDAFEPESEAPISRAIQQLLEGVALHSVEFDAAPVAEFRNAIREIAERFRVVTDYKDYPVLAGEANKKIHNYHSLVERFVRDLLVEKQLALELLTKSLLRVCHSSEKTAETLRRIEKDLGQASQVENVRDLRGKLNDCLGTLCLEAELQEAQFKELKQRVSESSSSLEPIDQVTGLSNLKSAEFRIRELAEAGRQGFVLVFFLKNIDVVNRRFGYEAGDEVLRKFAKYLKSQFRSTERLFRWRGPCFVAIAERFGSLDTIQAEAYKMGIRGPEAEVEGNGKSMLIRMTAATAAFAIPKGGAAFEISARIDQFAAEQFKASPVA